ncbi:MAG: hypothetical protein KF716_14540 [Anaerolineae bacterium]|nr:hypothetical protein [Anaerolineae bacterium]
MGHRLVSQQGSVTIRLDGKVNPHILAAELRDLLDKQATPLAVLIDFTHASDIDQAFKSQIYRMVQHPKAARTIGFYGLTPLLLQELQGLLTGLAQTRKIVVRDNEFDTLAAMNLATVPTNDRRLSGMVNFAKRA